MARIINFAMEVSDAEFAAFLERAATRAVPTTGETATAIPANAGQGGDDEGPVNGAAPAVDTRGIPWLEAVHASTKGVTAEGHWRRKKGVTNDQMVAAENAWRAANPTGGAQVAHTEAFTVPGSLTPSGQPVTIPAGPVSLPGAPVAPVAGLPGMTPPAAPVTYEAIGNKYQALAAAGKITPEAMTQYYAKYGITDVSILMNNEALRASLMNDLNLLG